MIPLEVVYRYVWTWSFIKREKKMKWEKAMLDWTILESPFYELFYKNDVILADWSNISDPMIVLDEDLNPVLYPDWRLALLNPATWEKLNYVDIKIPWGDSLSSKEIWEDISVIVDYAMEIRDITPKIFDKMRDDYLDLWIMLFDWKVEFWIDPQGELMLADVIDGDSCRLRIPSKVELSSWEELEWENLSRQPNIKRILAAEWLDKQGFREGEDADVTLAKYRRLAEILES